jgi:broad specificity phosphatase PhoE
MERRFCDDATVPTPTSRLVLVRHGETAWSATGRHTGRTDVPLTERGRKQARAARPLLDGTPIIAVATSPLARARTTCSLLGFDEQAVADPDLVEWDYGAYEGRTTADIRIGVPDWTVWTHPCPDGETAAQVATRVDRVIARARERDGLSLLVAHGHVLRVLTARWLGLDPTAGRYFRLDTATVSVLGWERETPVILRWNATAEAVR